MTQAELARAVGVVASAVAQWELPTGTSPTVSHLAHIATHTGVAFEWLATGRGCVAVAEHEVPAIDGIFLAADETEDRLLAAFRRMSARKRAAFVEWMEKVF